MATDIQHLAKIKNANELALWGDGVLPNGIEVSKHPEHNTFWGTRAALIMAGIGPEEWFPLEPVPGKCAGTIKHTFHYRDEAGRRIKVQAPTFWHANASKECENWSVEIPLPDEERVRLRMLADREREAYSTTSPLNQSLNVLRSAPMQTLALTLAPPVAPSSLSDTELHHIRLLRSFGDEKGWRDSILSATDLVFRSHEEQWRKGQAPSAPQKSRAHLVLV